MGGFILFNRKGNINQSLILLSFFIVYLKYNAFICNTCDLMFSI